MTHKLSAVENADRIYVLEHGKIVGEGRHPELLRNSEPYSSLYYANQYGSLHKA